MCICVCVRNIYIYIMCPPRLWNDDGRIQHHQSCGGKNLSNLCTAGFAQPDGSSQGSSLCTTGIRPSWEQLGRSWAGKFRMTRSDTVWHGLTRSDTVWHGDLPWTSKITSWRVSVAPKPVDFGVLAKVWLKQAKEERQTKVRTQTVPYPGMAREENVDGIYDDHRVTWHCQLHLWQSRP